MLAKQYHIKNIIFDLGNVLVFFSHEQMYRQLAELAGRSVEETKEFINLDSGPALSVGSMTTAQALERFCEWSDRQVGEREFDRAASDIFWLNLDMIALLARLKSRYNLVILSNTTEQHITWLAQKYDFFSNFNHKFYSFEMRLQKPDAKIYQETISRLGARAEECLFIDDLEENVTSARQCGLHAICYRGKSLLLPQLQQYGIDF